MWDYVCWTALRQFGQEDTPEFVSKPLPFLLIGCIACAASGVTCSAFDRICAVLRMVPNCIKFY